MNILVILGHPDPSSLNAALARSVAEALSAEGHEVILHDLCAEGFDPALPADEAARGARLDQAVALHCEELARAEGLVVVHPNWWGMPPAVLKGWIDRVFRPGVAYEFVDGDSGEGVPRGLLRLRAALVLNTANTHHEREARVFGDPLERIWKDCVFGLCTDTNHFNFQRRTFAVVCTSTPEQRAKWLSQAADMALGMFPS